MTKLITILLFVISAAYTQNSWAQEYAIKVGVLYGQTLTELQIQNGKGKANILFDSLSYNLQDTVFQLKIKSELKDSLSIFLGDSLILKCKMVRVILPQNDYCTIIYKEKNKRSYPGALNLTNVNGFVFVTNLIETENYLPGVLEAEVGLGRAPEYYKVQAIICRTYALSHLRRHEMEDINLCDTEHCQVYKGLSQKSTDLNKAVKKTEGVVMVDSDFMFITAAFHANCGGQTVNSEDVWNKKLDYLRSVKDTFCLRQRSAVWSVSLSADKWSSALLKLCPQYRSEEDSLIQSHEGAFLQFDRKKYYTESHSCMINLKDIRSSFALKSTFFNAYQKNGQIILNGRGFGHGVGLCQDGAMRMAKLGYSYKSILHYYYQNVSIVHLDKLDFFKFNE